MSAQQTQGGQVRGHWAGALDRASRGPGRGFRLGLAWPVEEWGKFVTLSFFSCMALDWGFTYSTCRSQTSQNNSHCWTSLKHWTENQGNSIIKLYLHINEVHGFQSHYTSYVHSLAGINALCYWLPAAPDSEIFLCATHLEQHGYTWVHLRKAQATPSPPHKPPSDSTSRLSLCMKFC